MNRNPLNLPEKLPEPGGKCNARTKTGYCKYLAGHGTTHVGTGRCHLHGGSTPPKLFGDAVFQTIYSKMLPTNLAIELSEIQRDPMFSNLFQEFSLLKLIIQGLLKELPVDLATMYGRPVCSECGKNLGKLIDFDSNDGEGVLSVIRIDWKLQLSRLTKLVSVIESMSRVYEKISKNEERQKRFIQISELEGLMVQWGKTLMKFFGDDPRIEEMQHELMTVGFLRSPGEQDVETLNKLNELRKDANYLRSSRKGMTSKDALKEVIVDYVTEGGKRSYLHGHLKKKKLKKKLKKKVKHEHSKQ